MITPLAASSFSTLETFHPWTAEELLEEIRPLKSLAFSPFSLGMGILITCPEARRHLSSDWLSSAPEKSGRELTKTRKISLLHIAAILGEVDLATLLLEKGALIDAQDRKGWTPLHYAALMGHQLMISFLISRGGNPALQNSHNGTFSNIARLGHLPPISPEAPTTLYLEEPPKRNSILTEAEFFALTGARFIRDSYMGRARMWQLAWYEDPPPTRALFDLSPSLATAYRDPPSHLLRKISTSAGYGLFALQKFSPHAVIGDYVGAFRPPDVFNPYCLQEGNALSLRNGLAHINDGFPNVAVLPFKNVEGLPCRTLFLTVTEVLPGRQFLFNYGKNHSVKSGPRIEFDFDEISRFICKELETPSLMEELLSTPPQSKQGFEVFVRRLKVEFILQTPSLWLLFGLEEILLPKKLEFLIELAKKHHFIGDFFYTDSPKETTPLALIPSEIARYLEILNSFTKEDLPEKRARLKDYLSDLLKRFGVMNVLTILSHINSALDKPEKSEIDLEALFTHAERHSTES